MIGKRINILCKTPLGKAGKRESEGNGHEEDSEKEIGGPETKSKIRN